MKVLRQFFYTIFYGNFFYGIAAVLLAMETAAKLPLGRLDWEFYVLLGLGTTFFYTESYSFDPAPKPGNKRADWIFKYRRILMAGQWIMGLLCLALAVSILIEYNEAIRQFNIGEWGMAIFFPLAAILYYGLSFPGVFKLNIRQNGFTKPFVIGMVWTGAVTIYPILMWALQSGELPDYSWRMLWYFTHNLMFITVLCVLFDIKDYAADHNADLKTFVVQHGLRSTIFRFVIPLVVLGICSYLAFWLPREIPHGRLLTNLIPFFLLLLIAYGMQKRRGILYYLAVIDGMMVAKALLGIASMLFFPQ